MDEEINCKCYHSIHDIDEKLWDSLLERGETIHSHRFLAVLENAKIEQSRLWYWLCYKNGKLIASAVLSAFKINLALFLEPALQRIIEKIRRFRPHFMEVEVLFCGTPISLGQHHLHISKEELSNSKVIKCIADEMEKIASEEHINYLCFKEFKENETEKFVPIKELGFFRANSIPYISLDIKWGSFEDYLGSLRHSYRRIVKKSLKKLDVKQPTFNASNSDEGYYWVIDDAENFSAEAFYNSYLSVMDRAENKLEILNLSFFEQLFRKLGKELKILAFKENENFLSLALLQSCKDELTFLLVGNKHAKLQEIDPYFNLVYGILSYAIANQYKKLHLGQTTYWTKLRLGGYPIPEYFYFKSKKKGIHFLLHRFNKFIFPELTLKSHKIFKTDAVNNG